MAKAKTDTDALLENLTPEQVRETVKRLRELAEALKNHAADLEGEIAAKVEKKRGRAA